MLYGAETSLVSGWRTDLTAGGGEPWTLQIKAAGSPLPTDSMLPMELPSLRVGLTLASGTVDCGSWWVSASGAI